MSKLNHISPFFTSHLKFSIFVINLRLLPSYPWDLPEDYTDSVTFGRAERFVGLDRYSTASGTLSTSSYSLKRGLWDDSGLGGGS